MVCLGSLKQRILQHNQPFWSSWILAFALCYQRKQSQRAACSAGLSQSQGEVASGTERGKNRSRRSRQRCWHTIGHGHGTCLCCERMPSPQGSCLPPSHRSVQPFTGSRKQVGPNAAFHKLLSHARRPTSMRPILFLGTWRCARRSWVVKNHRR